MKMPCFVPKLLKFFLYFYHPLYFNQFLAKAPENTLWFSGVFKGYEMRKLTKNGFIWFYSSSNVYPAGIYLLKVNNRNSRTKCEICSKVNNKDTRTTPIVVLVPLLLILNKFHTLF